MTDEVEQIPMKKIASEVARLTRCDVGEVTGYPYQFNLRLLPNVIVEIRLSGKRDEREDEKSSVRLAVKTDGKKKFDRGFKVRKAQRNAMSIAHVVMNSMLPEIEPVMAQRAERDRLHAEESREAEEMLLKIVGQFTTLERKHAGLDGEFISGVTSLNVHGGKDEINVYLAVPADKAVALVAFMKEIGIE